MNDTVAFWVVVISLAAGTFLLRSIPLWLHGHGPAPRWLKRLLRHVPAAALTALVIPGSLYVKANGSYDFAPARTAAAVAALLVAVRTRNVLATLATGMAVLWTVQALITVMG